MEITPALRKRLQEVGRALSETDVPLLIREAMPVSVKKETENKNCVVLTSKTPWAESDAEEWLAVSARRDHEYAHLRYTSFKVWNNFVKWAVKQEEVYIKDHRRGFPSAAFAADVFNAIEDARVERDWGMEYPGTAARISYNNYRCAGNVPVLRGVKALLTGLYYTALLGDIPGNLILSEEESGLLAKTRPLIEKGAGASGTSAAEEFVKKILKLFRNYLADNPEDYRQMIPDPGAAAESLKETPITAEENDSESGINFETAAESAVEEDTGSDKEKGNGEEPFDTTPENRNQALSTPGHGGKNEDAETEDDGDSGKNRQISTEEEYQQLLAGAEREVKNSVYRDDRTRFVIKKQAEADKLEKGIHEHIIPLDMDPEDLGDYYEDDFEALTPVSTIKNNYRKQITELSREIKEVLLYKKMLPERRLRKGWPDPGGLWKLSTGETKVFRKRNVDAAKPDVSVMLLVDCSRSMRRNSRSEFCKQSLVVAAESLEKNLVKYAICGFTTGTQYNTVVNIKYKDYEDTGFDSLDYYSGFNENRDGYSIRRAVRSVDNRSEKKKILIVLSDSVPNHTHVDRSEINYSFEMGKGLKDTILAIRETARKGIVVVGIFFGEKSDAARVRPIYPNFVYCEVLSLPRVLGSVLRRCLR